MKRGRPNVLGTGKVSIRVLLPEKDYEALEQIAEQERSDIGTQVRRAIVHFFNLPLKTRSGK